MTAQTERVARRWRAEADEADRNAQALPFGSAERARFEARAGTLRACARDAEVLLP